ncbi:class I SAM-dependent methyltransferase [Tolypothrix campylonemoides VB511288]|nr:class I SAM-dependent methyltransferase [Tolypothrix campylonemoides VB511288]
MQLRHAIWLLVASVSLIEVGIAGCTQKVEKNAKATKTSGQPQTEEQKIKCQLDAPYLPTPENVVEEILKLANVNKGDILYDLGSGDGRVVIAAAQKFGTQGVGVELDPQRIQEANENAQKAGVTNRVRFLQQNLFQTDISKATVVTLYLLPEVNLKLRPKLFRQLKPGTRIVSHEFDMGGWKPQRVVKVLGPKQGENFLYRDESCYTILLPDEQREHTLYFWVVPKNIPNSLR